MTKRLALVGLVMLCGATLADDAVKEMRGFLQNPDARVRITAINQVSALGEKARELIPDLAKIVRAAEPNKPSDEAAKAAAVVLGKLEAVEELTRCLDEKSVAVRNHAVAGLVLARDKAKPAVPRLKKLLAEPQCRLPALTALGRIDPDEPTWPLHLVALFQDGQIDREAKGRVVQELSSMGPAARKAVPALVPLLKDDKLCGETARALGRIGGGAREAVPELALLAEEQLATPGPVLNHAATALWSIRTPEGKLYPEARKVIHRIAASDRQRLVREVEVLTTAVAELRRTAAEERQQATEYKNKGDANRSQAALRKATAAEESARAKEQQLEQSKAQLAQLEKLLREV